MGCMDQYSHGISACPNCGYVEGTPVQEALHMEPGSILLERYIVGKVLGFGGFGVTYIGWDAKLEQKVAIKEYLPSEFSTRIPGQTQITVFNGAKAEQFQSGLSKFIEEAQRLAQFHKEEGIVRIFDSFVANNTAYIVMECLQGETLADYMKRTNIIPVDTAIAMLMPVIQSLKAVHDQGIIHRDVAPDNIFLTSDGKVKLIDFGAARFATTAHSRSLTVIIKPGYSPEEQYRSRGDQGSYTDVYAIGATLYRMVTGVVPPDALERRAYSEGKKKDILKPVGKFSREITENQEIAIHNALNVRVEDRTSDMATLAKELTTVAPDRVKRLHGKISKLPLYKWPVLAKIGVPAAMFALLIFGALFVFGIIGPGGDLQTEINIPSGMSRVPSVINNDAYQAEYRLGEATLLLRVAGRVQSDIVPADMVLTQSINGGAVVLYNTVIHVYISSAEQEIIPGVVPDVRFMDEARASQFVAAAGLAAYIRYEYSDTVAYGLVVYQDPDAGTQMDAGGRVYIVVSIGTPAFPMPNVIGMSENAARGILIESGLAVAVNYETNDNVPEGNVINQSIAPDADVYRGDLITLTVSGGADLVMVASVEGLPEGEAVSILTEQGFDVLVDEGESDDVEQGYVISQSPEAGSSQVRGATIVITVNSPELDSGQTPTPQANIQVANVVGQSQSNARSTLQNQGFIVSEQEAFSDSVAIGNVISQSPAAGSSQRSGSTVIITVSRGPEQVLVPNVVGSSQSSARRTLEDQGFSVYVQLEYSNTIENGRVISQSPSAGSVFEWGSIVIFVSRGPEPLPVSVTFTNMRVDWGNDPENPTYSFNYSIANGSQVTFVGISIEATGDTFSGTGATGMLSGSVQVSVAATTGFGEVFGWRAVVQVDGQWFYSDVQETFKPGLTLSR